MSRVAGGDGWRGNRGNTYPALDGRDYPAVDFSRNRRGCGGWRYVTVVAFVVFGCGRGWYRHSGGRAGGRFWRSRCGR